MSVRHRRFALEVLKNKNLSISLQNPIRPTETVAKCWKDHEKMKFGIVRVVKRYKKSPNPVCELFSVHLRKNSQIRVERKRNVPH